MRNHAVLAAFASLLIAVAAPSAIAAAGSPAITPANGNDFVLPDGTVYQANDDGTFSWIPDVATANAMKLVWNTLQPVDELPGPTAAPFASVRVHAFISDWSIV